ncbi:xanthine dehydrogenase accessory factor [Rubrivivax gelatinosus]|uniref:XdhC family protein n=1 Tax=Rubrivivax gelatinosus TaxID=28068 RepID=UPI0018CB57A5|nr:XdhC family protein [Rubrivivax gelatinosus]MBG6078479.1 xanthine dehydrogenase accessory factor [Rubrivivax gelatinosus]
MDDLDMQVLQAAAAWHALGRPTLLVCVARTWGSSPRPPGSLMAIDARGATVGSVSGGCLEDDLIEQVRAGGVEALCAAARPALRRYGVSAEQAQRFGLPCGGTVELVLEPVSAHSRLDELLQARRERRRVERVLHLDDGRVELRDAAHDAEPRLDVDRFVTVHGPRARLVLIGAGDLAAFMSRIAGGLGFEVLVCDPRTERHEGQAWPGVELSTEMPDDLILRLRPDHGTAVVALTHDPKLDDLALIEALQSDAFYVGAIGSRRNSERRRERLRTHFGLDDTQLQRLRGPAGLYIGSRTPAEIALSIMAELVAARNGVVPGAGRAVAEGKAAHDSARPGAACDA